MNTIIAKTWHASAAHQLPNHDGKCANLHGHTYQVTAGLAGVPNPPDGSPDECMLVDFSELDAWWDTVKPLMDHQFLNDTLPVERTTSEAIAAYLLRLLLNAFPGAGSTARAEFVRVSESPNTYAEARF